MKCLMKIELEFLVLNEESMFYFIEVFDLIDT